MPSWLANWQPPHCPAKHARNRPPARPPPPTSVTTWPPTPRARTPIAPSSTFRARPDVHFAAAVRSRTDRHHRSGALPHRPGTARSGHRSGHPARHQSSPGRTPLVTFTLTLTQLLLLLALAVGAAYTIDHFLGQLSDRYILFNRPGHLPSLVRTWYGPGRTVHHRGLGRCQVLDVDL